MSEDYTGKLVKKYGDDTGFSLSTEDPNFHWKLQPLDAFPKTAEELLQPVSAVQSRKSWENPPSPINDYRFESHCPFMTVL